MFQRIRSLSYRTFKNIFFTPASLLIALLIFLIPLWALRLEGDGTAVGKFRIFTTYTFLLASFLLIGLNIFISSLVLSRDWKRKSLYLLDVKPVRRWEILVGKWLGIQILNIVLLLFLYLSLVLSSYILEKRILPRLTGKKDILTTYIKVFPTAEKLGAHRMSPDSSPLTSPELTTGEKEKRVSLSIPPGSNATWIFEGIREGKSFLILQYRFYTAGKKEKKVGGVWMIGDPGTRKVFHFETEVTPGEIHQLRIPPEMVQKGRISVTYFNGDVEKRSVVFPRGEVNLLVPWGNYWLNLVMGEFMLYLILSFTSFVGLAFTTAISSITSIMATFTLVVLSFARPFVKILLDTLLQNIKSQPHFTFIPRISFLLVSSLNRILPPLDKCLPHVFLGNSLIPPLSLVGKLFLEITLLKGGIIFLLGILYFSRKEIGIPNE